MPAATSAVDGSRHAQAIQRLHAPFKLQREREMKNLVSRRCAIQMALAGCVLYSPLGVLAAPTPVVSPGPSPMYPAGFLKVLGFFEGNDKDWYEGVHAPDFVSFAAPYMARYARNWVEEVEAGAAPSFNVITEIQYKNDAAKNRVRELQNSSAGAPLMEHVASHFAGASNNPRPAAQPNLFSVTPRSMMRPNLASPATTVRRRILLLRRSNDLAEISQSLLPILGCRWI
jgi:hypothetical protein